MTKEADTEGFSFPDPAELAECSPHPSARMRELPAQHSPFQRSPLLPPACCTRTASINCSQLPVLGVLQHTPAAACPDGDVHTHVRCLAHTHSALLAANTCWVSHPRLGASGRHTHLTLPENPHISTNKPGVCGFMVFLRVWKSNGTRSSTWRKAVAHQVSPGCKLLVVLEQTPPAFTYLVLALQESVLHT